MFSPRRLSRRNYTQPFTTLSVHYSQQSRSGLSDQKSALFTIDEL
jgi:hypothetical protein